MATIYFANCGPIDGPIHRGTRPPSIGVSLDGKHPERSDGIAYTSGSVPDGHKLIALWRLVVRKVEIEGLWAMRTGKETQEVFWYSVQPSDFVVDHDRNLVALQPHGRAPST